MGINGRLRQPGQAPAGVDHAVGDRPGRAAVEGTVGRSASVGDRAGTTGDPASVSTAPSTNQLPDPAAARLALLPNQLIPPGERRPGRPGRCHQRDTTVLEPGVAQVRGDGVEGTAKDLVLSPTGGDLAGSVPADRARTGR